MHTLKTFFGLAARIAVAVIYLQTLYFKFSAHPDSVYIFTTLGIEPWGRIALGGVELLTALLVVWPRTSLYGMLLSTGIITGAILAHLGPLGIAVQGDGGKVFYLAVAVFVLSVGHLLWHIADLRLAMRKLF